MAGARPRGAEPGGAGAAGLGARGALVQVHKQVTRIIIFSLALLFVRASCEAATGQDMVEYLECYRCTAYEFEDDFRSKLSRCESGQIEETVQCPYEIIREDQSYDVTPGCTVVKQKAAGAITSYTRGCKFFANCTDIDQCGESTDETGVCMSCCYSDLCNAAPSSVIDRLHSLWTLAAILVATLLIR